MTYQERSYPLFSACGLNCGLCPRYYTDGASKCPGCSGAGFLEKHPTCGVLTCCQRHGLEYCFLCPEYPCKKYDGADQYDSFISHKNQFIDNEKAKRVGMGAYQAELDKKVIILQKLLAEFDDGRRKGFYCIAVNLLSLPELDSTMDQISCLDGTPKEKAQSAVQLLQDAADRQGIDLRLRKKGKK